MPDAGGFRFYFDFISPYAFLAWKRIVPMASTHGRSLELVPVLFAALLDHHGQLGPAEIPPKRIATYRKVVRRAAARGCELVPPKAHPFNPLLGLRLASLDHADQTEQIAIIDRLFDAAWAGRGGPITDAAVVATMLDELGMNGEALCNAATAPEIKARVRAQTEHAITSGLFGVPTTEFGGELFWGDDGLDELEMVLAGDDPFALGLASVDDVPVGRHRKR